MALIERKKCELFHIDEKKRNDRKRKENVP